ncbi:MAG TPA: hypothetical protein V6D05_15040 [Stenomitos sp.]
MRSRLLQRLMVATVVAALNGCGELPFVGDLGATLSGLTAPLAGLPVIGQFFAKAEEPPPAPPPRPRRVRRRTVAVANPGAAAATAEATDSAEVQAVAQTPATAYVAWSERNRRFDKLRTDGLMQLYNGQTAGAIHSFKEAQSLRPEDSTIRTLVALAENPGTFRSEGVNAPGGTPAGGAEAPPVPQVPASALGGAGATGALNQLLKGVQGAPGGAGPQGGDQPGGLF